MLTINKTLCFTYFRFKNKPEHPEEVPEIEVSSVITCTEDGDRYEVTGGELEAIAAELDIEIWQLVMDGEGDVD